MRILIMSHHATHTSAHSKPSPKDDAAKVVPGPRLNAGNDGSELDTVPPASFVTGFAEADDRESAQLVLDYGTMQVAAGDQAAARFPEAVTAYITELTGALHDPAQSLRAIHIAATACKPVVIVAHQECTSPRSRIASSARLLWNRLRDDIPMTPMGAGFNHENRGSGT